MSLPIALISLAGCSLLIMVISLPLMLERIPKNGLYGFRTRASMSSSEDEWYRLNRIAGSALFIAGFVSLAACLIMPSFLSNATLLTQICTCILLISVIVATVFALSQQRR